MDELTVGCYRLRVEAGVLVAHHHMLARPVELPEKSLEAWITRRVRAAISTTAEPEPADKEAA